MKILFRSRDISYKVLRPFKKITYFRVSRPCILEVHVAVEHADESSKKSKQSCPTRNYFQGKKIYKHVRDVLEEVVEYFTSIAHLGGRRMANFIHRPKNIGDGPSSGVIPRINSPWCSG